MKIPQHLPCWLSLLLGCSTLFLSGCITVSENMFQSSLSYEPAPSAVKIDASYTLTTIHEIAPELLPIWHNWGNSDESIANYRKAFGRVVGEDIIKSGLLARLVAAGQDPDFALKILTTDSKQGGNYVLLISYELTDPRANRLINQRTLTITYGPGMFDVKPKDRLPGAMNQVKAAIIADLQGVIRQRQQVMAQGEAELMAKARLVDLLVASAQTVATARARNRAIIAAKTTQLPGLLRDSKTDELTALVVKIEQTILDLNHECEIAKDRAQQAVAAGPAETGGVAPDDLREFALSYRERIELLKPIGAAIKDELANRNR